MKPTGILISLLAGVALCSARQAPVLDDLIASKQTSGHNRHANSIGPNEGLRRMLFGEDGIFQSSSFMKDFKAMRQSMHVSSFLHLRRTQKSVMGPSSVGDVPKYNEGKSGGKGNINTAGKGYTHAVSGKDAVSVVGGKGSQSVYGGKSGKASNGASKESSKGKGKASNKSSKKQQNFCRDFTFTDQRRLQNGGEDCSPNILDVASKNPDLSIFVDLIQRAGLEDVFNCAGMDQFAFSGASLLFFYL